MVRSSYYYTQDHVFESPTFIIDLINTDFVKIFKPLDQLLKLILLTTGVVNLSNYANKMLL